MAKNNNGLVLLFGEDHREWKFTRDILPMITPSYISQTIAKLASEKYQNIDGVWDMFGGIGGDAVPLSAYFDAFVTELNPTTYEFLSDNCSKFHGSHQIFIECVDCVEYLDKEPPLKVDMIYFDPPWGESFRTNETFDFHDVILENGMNVVELLKKVMAKYDCMIIKSPLTCETFDEILADYKPEIFRFKKHKLKFLFIQKDSSLFHKDSSLFLKV